MPVDDLGRIAARIGSARLDPRRKGAKTLEAALCWGAKIQSGAKLFENDGPLWYALAARALPTHSFKSLARAISSSSMALYSLSVSCQGAGSITCQIEATDPRAALRSFLGGEDLARFLSAQRGWPKVFSEADIYAFLPVAGMKNVYQCELGRSGKYMSVTLTRTVSRAEPKPDLRRWLVDNAVAARRRRRTPGTSA
jgi:hypothetical protein